MIKIFANDQVRSLDMYTIENKPIASSDLVEEAAMAFVKEFCLHYSKISRIIVFAGQGKNGADALAIARMLNDESYKVITYLINPTNYLCPECEENRRRLLNLEQAEFFEIQKEFVLPTLTERDVVIDGLFGTGLNKPLEGGFAGLVNFINNSPAKVVSIDIPSGLFGEDNRGNNMNAIIKADMTLTFNYPKLSFLFPENACYVGEWQIINVDILPEIIEMTPTRYKMITEEDMQQVYHPRPRFSHKGTYGHALLIAGSRGKMGAAMLSAKACLRSGVGLITAHVPKCGEQLMQTYIPEAMVETDKHNDLLTEIQNVSAFSAIGIGPGIGQEVESAVAIDELFDKVDSPMVIDADALNIISSNESLLGKIPANSILTPHPKEFDRLAGPSNSAYEIMLKASEFAKRYNLCIVLKDAYTAVCTPEGNVYFNSCGNPGMATAGSGDVLTGIILGFLAQGMEPKTAAVSGVFIHATAGDFAAATKSEESMIASDITEALGKAFKSLKQI